jgi:rhodanese-related sulfurtransferase
MMIMTKTKVWMLAILFISFFAVSCDTEDDAPEINEAELLIEWVETASSPAANYGNSGLAIKSATAVHTLDEAGKVYIIDIRSATDFAAGHIEGAVNLASSDVRAHIDATDLAAYEEVSIVCYTGQTASWLTGLLQLAGYKDVYSMAFGMSAWSVDFDKWTTNTSNEKATLFVSDVSDKAEEGDLPLLTTGFETAEEIFDARWDIVLAEGFGAAAITNADVYANLADYYIINYWPNEEYVTPGHIEGAIQYTPNVDLALEEALKTLPTDKTIVVYCYTGQNSARIASYLRVLGYDAKSLKFGANGMIYDELTGHKWVESADYDYVISE